MVDDRLYTNSFDPDEPFDIDLAEDPSDIHLANIQDGNDDFYNDPDEDERFRKDEELEDILDEDREPTEEELAEID